MGLLLVTLFALYAICSAAALAVLWRRQERLRTELTELRRAASASTAPAVLRRARGGGVVPVDVERAPLADNRPHARAARTWGLQASADADAPASSLSLSAETVRGLVLGVLATAPAFGFLLHADAPITIASGLAVAAAMMVVALRPVWTVAAWAAVFTAAGWASLGLAIGAAHADPASYAICVAFAGAAGLVYTHLRQASPGATMALAMSAAVLALASQTGMIGPAGAGFGTLVAMAAIVGAMSLRLEAMHLAAFGAAVIGLFVLSGQESAAIWFTPVTTWMGALFLGIAVIRVPQLGARGVALAGTGAFGALGAILALNGAQHGLADAFAAAGALVVLAAILGGVIAATALRRSRGLAALRFTLWILALAAFVAVASAIFLAAPAPFAASAFALVALGLIALNARIAEGTWRVFAGAAALLGMPFALASAQMVLSETPGWPAWAIVALGLGLPAVALGVSALLGSRHGARKLAAMLEITVIALAVSTASLAVHLTFAEGAVRLARVGFVETGIHASVWLLAALIIGARAHLGAVQMRIAGINLLTVAALSMMVIASLLWTTNYWTARAGAGPDLLQRETLGFLVPAVMFFAHWVFWRARADDLQTRLVFGASMLLLAAFVTMEAVRAAHFPDWARALAGATSFAVALGLNFAPGVTNADGPAPRSRRQFEKNLHGERRREQGRQPREHV